MRWTLEDDAAFFAARGVRTSLGSEMPEGRIGAPDYPNVAAHEMRLWQAIADITGAQVWGQAFFTMPDNPFATAMFDVSTGWISVVDSVVEHFELFLDDTAEPDRPWFPNELRILKASAAAIFHEMVHAAGPEDRGQYVRERVETNADHRAQLVLEGATELRVQRDINLFLDRTGLMARAPALADAAYTNYYPAESAFVATLFAGMTQSPEALLDWFVTQGCSKRALETIIVEHVRDAHATVDDATTKLAVEAVLDAAESMLGTYTQTRTLPTWHDYRTQVGTEAGRTALAELRPLVDLRSSGVDLSL